MEQRLTNNILHYNLTRLSTKPILIPSSKWNHRFPGHSRQSPSNLKDITTAEPNEFSLYGHDVDLLNVQMSVSGQDMIRLTIRDATKDRYEVPVPIEWHPTSMSTKKNAKLQFELTKTVNEQVGFRIKRTDTHAVIFDTTYFAHGFIYDDQFLQFITTIPSRNVYGKRISII